MNIIRVIIETLSEATTVTIKTVFEIPKVTVENSSADGFLGILLSFFMIGFLIFGAIRGCTYFTETHIIKAINPNYKTSFEINEEKSKKAKEKEQRKKTQTKVIKTFQDVSRNTGKPTLTGVTITDVSVLVWSGEGFNRPDRSPIFFADIKHTPIKSAFRQFAFGWNGYAVTIDSTSLLDSTSIVFRESRSRDDFYESLITAIAAWKQKFPD